MKHNFTALFVCAAATCIPAKGWYFEYDGLSYSVNEGAEGVCKVGTNPGKSGKLTIPSTVYFGDNPYTVIGVEDNAFGGCSGLTSISLPSSVTSIGMQAFIYCTGLTSFTVPEKVTTIKPQTFFGCSALSSVKLSSGTTEIGLGAFQECNAIESINLPDGLKVIGEYAFLSCNGLTSLTIPGKVTSIGASAFNVCKALREVYISASVAEIGQWAFTGCDALEEFKVSDDNEHFRSIGGALYDKDVTVLICCPAQNTGIYTLPESVKEIGTCAFWDCFGLTEIVFPQDLETIGTFAFGYCTGLTSVDLPDNVKVIDQVAFANCENLTSIKLPASLEVLEKVVFMNCGALKTVEYYADNLIEAPENAFDTEIYENATLKVSESALEQAETVTPWNLFSKREAGGSGVIGISSGEAGRYAIYNLNGIRVSDTAKDLPAGIYLVREGEKVKKIMIK